MEFVVVGNPTLDVVKGEERIGGAVIYTSLTIANMGYPVTIVGAHGPDFSFVDNRIVSRLVEKKETTKFKFDGDFRILTLGSPISIRDLTNIRGKIVHCAPVFNEISDNVLTYLREEAAFLSLDVQGFVRREKEGNIYLAMFKSSVEADFVKASEEEARFLDIKSQMKAITKGGRGVTIFAEETYEIPAFPARIVDCIGAGDIFCGAFLVRYFETKDVYEAGIFASAAASLSCEATGISSIPTRREITEKVKSRSSSP
jgi:sugar/nucleoside kinase (ribokinase family)